MSLLCVSYLPPYFLAFYLKNPRQVVWAGLAGPEVGNSLTDVLYGAWNPSGRLPYTIAKSPLDYPAQLVTGGEAGEILSIPYTEGQVLLAFMKNKVCTDVQLTGCMSITGTSMP